MQRGRGVFVANPPQNAFLFFVMLQRCTSSIPGSADSVKFYIVFFFLSYRRSCILVSVSQLFSQVAILRLIYFCVRVCFIPEHVKTISKTDTNFNRLQNHENKTPERENYNSFVGETTSSHQTNKLPKRGTRMSAQSFSQLVSDVPTKGQAQCADLTPIVTYEGNEETPARAAKATSTGYSHREVKVIVHNKKTHSSTSSSSSTCSSVRSFGQRRHPVKHHFDRSRDCSPLLTSHQTDKRSSERSDFSSAENKAVGSQQVSSTTCIDERNAECEETIELQIVNTVNNASDKTDGDPSNAEANDDRITKQGGSLADMFDS